MAPLVFVRPGELRQMEWAKIDFDAKEWNIPVHKMNMREPHLVPLSQQALAIHRDLRPRTGNHAHTFPRGHGPRVITHGFRAIAHMLLDEELGFRPDHIEHQLAYAVKDANGCAYKQTQKTARYLTISISFASTHNHPD